MAIKSMVKTDFDNIDHPFRSFRYRTQMKDNNIAWLTLFASTGTLVCCALPIILVTLGLGTTVVALTGTFPFLITLSQHKVWVFTFSGAILGVMGWLLYRPGRICPSDPKLNALCEKVQVWNRRIYFASAIIWGIGLFAAYLALPMRIWLGM